MRRPTRHEESEIAEHVEKSGEARRTGSPCFGFLKVRTERGIREMFLSDRSSISARHAFVDWRRAPLATAFFACRHGEEFEIEVDDRSLAGVVEARALYTFDQGTLVEVDRWDRRYVWTGSARWMVDEPSAPRLRAKKRRVHALKDVLDPNQQRVVELPSGRAVLILGEAGFGKTTAAIHRLAALAKRSLVIVPAAGLARLAKRLLDRLGARDVEIATFDDWILREARRVFPGLPRRDARNVSPAVARLKRHPVLREILPSIAARAERRPRRDLLHLFGDRALMEAVVERAGGEVPRHAVPEILEHTHIQFSPTSEQAYAHVDRDRLVTVDGLTIDEGTPLEDAQTIDAEDGAVLFEIHRLRTGSDKTRRGRLSRYDVVVIDEAQELAPIELSVLGRALSPGGSLIVSGDEAQKTDERSSFLGWDELMRTLGVERHETVVLEESHRSPPEVLRFARSLVGRGGRSSSVRIISMPSACHLEAKLLEVLERLRARDPRATIAIVCRDAASARAHHATLARTLPLSLVLDGDFSFEPGAVVTTVAEVKGLEFDVVVVPDADRAHYPDTPESRRALYVAVTRSLDQVVLLGVGPPAMASGG